MQKTKVLAVISGDIHYDLNNLEIADAATNLAIDKANELNVPFISNGDLHNSKANMRAECVNRIISTFKRCRVKPYVNVGNHSLINIKGKTHALNFLEPYANIIEKITYVPELESYIIPYYDDVESLRAALKSLGVWSRLIMHQGMNGGNMGEYIKDPSALSSNDLKDFRTILSHYHARQDIICGELKHNNIGLASYIGSPYTITYAEHSDLPKSFALLYEDGSLDFVPTNLRKHVIMNIDIAPFRNEFTLASDYRGRISPEDLLWVKVKGRKEYLKDITKESLGPFVEFKTEFRLDLIPTDNDRYQIETSRSLSQFEQLDAIIDSTSNSDDCKIRLKELWKNLV